MTNFPKGEILKGLSYNLALFFPHLANHFMCPVCWKTLHIHNDAKRITEAHLIPKAASGKSSTLLCEDCNHRFGAKQDKWFGEQVRLFQRGQHPFLSKLKEHRFEIDGIQVNGEWLMTEYGDFTFKIHKHRNPPDILQQLSAKFDRKPSEVEFSISVPLLRQARLVSIGYLAMAYLYWFTFFGYSWVFQRHLDIVRHQILNPDQDILHERCFTKFFQRVDPFELPHFVSISIGELRSAGMVFNDVAIFFPTPNCPEFYDKLEGLVEADGQVDTDMLFLHFDAFYFKAIISVSHLHDMLMIPDSGPDLIDAGVPGVHLLFKDQESKPVALRSVTANVAGESYKRGYARITRVLQDSHPTPCGLLPPARAAKT